MDHQSSEWNQNASTSSTDSDRTSTAQLAEDAKQHLQGMAERQKALGADQISAFAKAFHSAAAGLERESPATATYVHDAANRLDRFSAAVRERSLDDLMGQVRGFARAQPLTFFGGAVLAGFAVSRFLKSSTGAQPGPRT